jgi:acetyl esterase/lipase
MTAKPQPRIVAYTHRGERDLHLHLFLPPEASCSRLYPAILFLHGGGFIQGDPAQFAPHCRYFSARGMVAASAQYRLLQQGATSLADCIADSRMALHWLRAQADDLHMDPSRIVAGGGSAGGHLAASMAMQAAGNQCDLIAYPGEHGFFNFGREENRLFCQTVQAIDAFLVGLGILDAAPPLSCQEMVAIST